MRSAFSRNGLLGRVVWRLRRLSGFVAMTIAIPPLHYLKIEANYVLSISAHNAFLCPLKQMNAFDLLSLSAFTSWRHVYHGVYGGFFLFLTEVIFSILIPSGFLLAILSNCIQNSPVSEGLFQINAGETIYQYGVPWLSLDMLIGA